MTLGDFFVYLSTHATTVVCYYVAIPIVAGLAYFFGKGEGHLSPWKYLYSLLIYLSAIPGLFAVSLTVYLFLFERQSIMQTSLYNQILPVLSLIVTFFVIRKNVSFDRIPGFDKISGLIIMITVLIALMWILEKTRILAITFLPFHLVLVIFCLLLLAMVIGWQRLTR